MEIWEAFSSVRTLKAVPVCLRSLSAKLTFRLTPICIAPEPSAHVDKVSASRQTSLAGVVRWTSIIDNRSDEK